ncbi:MAG: hypothetical protein IT449_15795 [Phycisphaerales bacterium]|nr:hypothetical protein [Phycisphaerales bacterium]
MQALDAAAPDLGMFLTGMSVALLGAGLLGDLALHHNRTEPGGVAILISLALSLVALRATAVKLWRLRAGLVGDAAPPRGPDFGVAGLPVQPSFAWMQVSLLAMFCGLIAAFSPVLTSGALDLRSVLEAGFFWTPGSAFARDMVMALVAALAPMMALSAVVLCLQRLRSDGGWTAVAVAWACIGGGVAAMLVRSGSWLSAPPVLQRAGAVPALALSFLAVHASSRFQRRALPSTHSAVAPALASSRRPFLDGAGLIAALLALTGALAVALARIDSARAASREALPEASSPGAAVALLMFGCGALARGRLRRMRASRRAGATWQTAITAGVLGLLLLAANRANPAERGASTVILGAIGLVCGGSWAALLERRLLRSTAPASAGFIYAVLSLLCLALVKLLLPG